MQRALAITLLLLAGTVRADPGHGIASLWHLLTEPDHLAMIVLPLAIGAGVLLLWRRAGKVRSPFRE